MLSKWSHKSSVFRSVSPDATELCWGSSEVQRSILLCPKKTNFRVGGGGGAGACLNTSCESTYKETTEFQSSCTSLQSFISSTPKALVLVCQKRISTEVEEPLKLALTVGCEFPIHTKLHAFPTLLVCWSTLGAQTIHRPLGLAHPSPPIQLSRSRCGRNVLWLLSTHTTCFPSQGKKHWEETWLLRKSQLGRRMGTVGDECVQLTWELEDTQGLTAQHM